MVIMSKNVLKDAQKRRDKKQSGDKGDSQDASSVRDALLDAETRDEQPTKRLNAEVPSGLHERFKTTCKKEDKSMTDVLTQLLETYVELKE